MLSTTPGPAMAQAGKEWVGKRVITKFGAVLRVDDKVIDNQDLANDWRGGKRQVFRIYRVEHTNGPWLWLQDERSGIAGWVTSDWLIPVDQAVDSFTNQIRADPADTSAYIRRSQIWRDKKEYDIAIADLSEAIKIEPNNESLFINRGNTYSQKMDYEKAIADFNEAIRIDPNFALAHLGRGCAKYAKSEYEKAITDFSEAIRLDPRLAVAYYNRGTAWFQKKEYAKSADDHGEAIRLDPRYSSACFYRSVALMILGRENAIRGFRRVLVIDKGVGLYATQSVILGHFSARQVGDEAEARSFLDGRAAKLDAASWPFPAVRFLRGELDEAGLLALVDDDKRTEARCFLGLDHLLKGRKEEGLVHLRWLRDPGAKTVVEYAIAMAELDRLEHPR